ncbi:MAG: FecR family protein [Methylovulum sp.]|nr:FecR family protein [Methylovulum sp.]
MNDIDETQRHPTQAEAELTDRVDGQAASWFARLRTGQVSDQEKLAFEHWLAQDEAHSLAYHEISMLWNGVQLKQASRTGGLSSQRPPQQASVPYWPKPLLMAACVALLFIFQTELTVLFQADYSTVVGRQQTVHLADGTVITLNTNSAFAVTMSDDQRTVELFKGEAYIDVQPDARRPFIVYASHSATRVLGTRFFVHTQAASDAITVVSGRVEVTNHVRWQESVILHDHDSALVNKATLSKTSNPGPALASSWLDGYLVFQDTPLGDALDQVQRYRNGVVIFKDDSLRQFRINGRINLHDTAGMIDSLTKALPITITHLSDWITIIG